MGANIGTTITSWMLSLTGIEGNTFWLRLLKPSSFSPVLAAVGIILVLGSRAESGKKDVGGIMLGFACARDFFKKMEKIIPDLCLVDIMLSDESGNEIVKHIVEIHGADIKLDSAPGVGTTVIISF